MDFVIIPGLFVLWLVGTAIDIALFFLAIRMLRRTWSARWLEAFDSVGRPLVDGMLEVLDKNVARWNSAHLREGPKLVLCMMILWSVRFLVTLAFHEIGGC